MKNTTTLLACLLLASCTIPKPSEETLDERVNTEVKQIVLKNFKDPQSYSFVENKMDTVRYIQYLAETSEENGKAVREYEVVWKQALSSLDPKSTEFKVCNEKLNTKMSDWKNTIKKLDATQKNKLLADSVVRVDITHVYRAKNGFGALNLGQLEFAYYPQKDSLELKPAE